MSDLMIRWRNAICFLFMPFIFFGTNRTAMAYQAAEHADIGTHARDNYIAYVQSHYDTAVGITALQNQNHWDIIAHWIVAEDDESPEGEWMPYLRHFYDPTTGAGLYIYPNQYESALTRVNRFWNDTVLPSYRDGNYQQAYQFLGRVLHVAMDMGVPAHVNLDPHPLSDHYESIYIGTHHVHTTTVSTATALHAIMETLALASRNFDSDDVNGVVDQGTRRTDGFTDAECAAIAQVCYPGAEEAAGGIFRLFYDTVRPIIQLLRPAQEEVHSGLIGVPFEAKAHSYEKQFGDADFIRQVDFDYAEVDNPATNDWTNAGTDATPDGSCKYTFNWQNSIDDDKVWVRATAMDDGDCDSLREKFWIKTDSTRPTISNKKP